MGTIVTISGLPIDLQKVASYSLEETTYNSSLVECGIMTRDAEFDNIAASTGTTGKMPFWKDLEGASEVLPTDGTTKLTTKDIGAGLDACARNSGSASTRDIYTKQPFILPVKNKKVYISGDTQNVKSKGDLTVETYRKLGVGFDTTNESEVTQDE